jgi:MoaA/NifB/PqqE/SkfB family radical SAM enzyme
MSLTPLRRRVRALERRVRQARCLARAFQFPYQPIVAQIIPTRRCNLSCAYCNEYDRVSDPVPLDEMRSRIDRLARLGTGIITLSGGEPLLHPDAAELIRHIRRRGAIATLITNGYLLTPSMIQALNRAGLDSLQISIDNVNPDSVSKKSLKVLDRTLRTLAQQAEFDVIVNAVVGGGIANPEDALVVAQRARALGFHSTVGLIHDADGQLRPLDAREFGVLERIAALERPLLSFDRYSRFQNALAQGVASEWHCRAGSRYLYVCEDGLVHYCSQQRGRPGIPLSEYSEDDLRREHASIKTCAPRCTIGCVHRVALIDELRESPIRTLEDWFGSSSTPPLPVRVLLRVFVTGRGSGLARRAVRRVLSTGKPAESSGIPAA